MPKIALIALASAFILAGCNTVSDVQSAHTSYTPSAEALLVTRPFRL